MFTVILLGEGDFTFAASLVRALKYWKKLETGYNASEVPEKRYNKSSVNKIRKEVLTAYLGLQNETTLPDELHLTASSLDSVGEVLRKYPNAKQALKYLELPRRYPVVKVIHGCDATKLESNWDRICWNHPHIGREDCAGNKNLINDFLKAASLCLKADSLITLTILSKQRISWEIEDCVKSNHFEAVQTLPFRIEDYPGVQRRRNNSRGHFDNVRTLTMYGNHLGDEQWDISLILKKKKMSPLKRRERTRK